MSNVNTMAGFYNLPAQVISVNTEIALLVPAAAGVYPALPSPALPASSGLVVEFPNDLAGAMSVDAHPFKVRIAGVVKNPGAGTLTIKMYQVAQAQVGVIGAAGSVTAAGAPGTGATAIHATAALTQANPSHFAMEFDLFWSSAVARLDGYVNGVQNTSTLIAQAAISAPLSSGVAAVNQLNFMPSFTFSVANAANSVQLSEFVIERV